MIAAETPRFAHLGVLLFLGSGFLTLVCLVTALFTALARRFRVAKLASAAAVLMASGYGAVLLAVSLSSPPKTLDAGGWKYFCEADCHIAYRVESVQFASGPELAARPETTVGRFVIVRLKTWFDERSIAPWRGDAPLTPDPRTVELIDARGQRYSPKPDLAAAWDPASTPLSQPLRPGQSYLTTLVFDLPSGAGDPKLLIADQAPVSRFLVDHENSPLHGKIYLPLLHSPSAAAHR